MFMKFHQYMDLAQSYPYLMLCQCQYKNEVTGVNFVLSAI